MANVITGILAQDWGTKQSQSIAASGNFLIPKGIWVLFDEAAADLKLQVQTNEGTPTWTDVKLQSDAIGGFVISDGVNVRVLNTDSGNAATLVYQELKFLP